MGDFFSLKNKEIKIGMIFIKYDKEFIYWPNQGNYKCSIAV